jgi:hypothetical protein
MKYQLKVVLGILLIVDSFFCLAQDNHVIFDELNKNNQWNLVFKDNCKNDWTKNWFLDGLKATVENTKKGMRFSAGPEVLNDAHHAVLWTKASFTGDIKIEYDYTRTDTENRWVNILYIQATGNGEAEYVSDISKWNKLREIPAMKTYFENMNALHISYAAFGNEGDGTYYVRARRYPKPNNKSFDVTKIAPSYNQQGYFKTGQTYHITVIKSGHQLFFKKDSVDGVELFLWDISNIKPINGGRIGLRQMYSRSSIYHNFKIYSK